MVEMAFYGKQMKGNSVSEETWARCFIANFISCSLRHILCRDPEPRTR